MPIFNIIIYFKINNINKKILILIYNKYNKYLKNVKNIKNVKNVKNVKNIKNIKNYYIYILSKLIIYKTLLHKIPNNKSLNFVFLVIVILSYLLL